MFWIERRSHRLFRATYIPRAALMTNRCKRKAKSRISLIKTTSTRYCCFINAEPILNKQFSSHRHIKQQCSAHMPGASMVTIRETLTDCSWHHRAAQRHITWGVLSMPITSFPRQTHDYKQRPPDIIGLSKQNVRPSSESRSTQLEILKKSHSTR